MREPARKRGRKFCRLAHPHRVATHSFRDLHKIDAGQIEPGHIAHLIRETVREGLDLRAILSQYDEERGYPPYHPGMMTALLLYAYSQGIYSSRRIDRACHERVDFMAVTGLSYPDFRTISEFRKRHLGALSGLFVQVLGL